jgi:rhodanese-related sulfurtransferase
MPRTSKKSPQPVPTDPHDPPGRNKKSKAGGPSGRVNASKASYHASRKHKAVRTLWTTVLAVVAVFAIGLIIIVAVQKFSPWGFSEEISPAQAKNQISNGAIVVDVRTYDEFVGGHIENSLWMPLEDLATLMQTLPRNRLIILVCRSGVRSTQARYILLEAGFTQVTSMTGGLQAWVAAGYPTVAGEPIQN